MRRSHLFFLLVIIILLILSLRSVSTLLSLVTGDAATDVTQPDEIPATDSILNSSQPQLIPKIIHQTYANASIPERWRLAQQSCMELHPDYDYRFWTDEDSHTFIAREYPWFLETFQGYRHNIQRADAIRYFVLAHYGGTYIDLDNGCRRRLDPLLSFPAWVHLTEPSGISNDGMGATPRHPFFLYVIEQLQLYDRWWVLPYITIMSTTGPLFLSVVWKKYNSLHIKEHANWQGRVRVVMPGDYYRRPTSFFDVDYGGSSWHGSDAKFVLWMGQHIAFTTVGGIALGSIACLCIWWMYMKMINRKGNDYPSVVGAGPSQAARQSRTWRWPKGMLLGTRMVPSEYELA